MKKLLLLLILASFWAQGQTSPTVVDGDDFRDGTLTINNIEYSVPDQAYGDQLEGYFWKSAGIFLSQDVSGGNQINIVRNQRFDANRLQNGYRVRLTFDRYRGDTYTGVSNDVSANGPGGGIRINSETRRVTFNTTFPDHYTSANGQIYIYRFDAFRFQSINPFGVGTSIND